jgi:hypothetical protein
MDTDDKLERKAIRENLTTFRSNHDEILRRISLPYFPKITKKLWGFQTPPTSQSSLNEIVLRSHERSVESLRKVDFSKNG